MPRLTDEIAVGIGVYEPYNLRFRSFVEVHIFQFVPQLARRLGPAECKKSFQKATSPVWRSVFASAGRKVRAALEPAVIPQVAVCAQFYATYESGAK